MWCVKPGEKQMQWVCFSLMTFTKGGSPLSDNFYFCSHDNRLNIFPNQLSQHLKISISDWFNLFKNKKYFIFGLTVNIGDVSNPQAKNSRKITIVAW